MTRPTALLAAALALCGLGAGCATTSAAGLRRQRLSAALDATRLDVPLDDLWPQVRHLLAERNLPLTGADAEAEKQEHYGSLMQLLSRAKETVPTSAGGLRLETGWGPELVRYLAEAVPDGTGFRVRFTVVREHTTEHGHDGERRRDPELELELVRRVAPALAAAVLGRVDAPATP